jgi:hypothetical protein
MTASSLEAAAAQDIVPVHAPIQPACELRLLDSGFRCPAPE